MTKANDLRSLLIGGLLALLVVCVLGATPRLRPSPGPVGRYTLIASPVSDQHAYVIDTITGQVWPRRVDGGTLEEKRTMDAFLASKLRTQASAEPNKPNTR